MNNVSYILKHYVWLAYHQFLQSQEKSYADDFNKWKSGHDDNQ